MACLKNWIFTWWDLGLRNKFVGDPSDSVEFDGGVLWSHDLGAHSFGEFSHAVIQANNYVEDQSHVDTADGAIFVGVYDGHGGDITSRFISDDLFTRFNALAQQRHTINGNVLTDAFAGTEEAFLNLVRERQSEDVNMKLVGSCCLTAVIWGGRLYVANAGDSRIVIGRRCPLGTGMYAEQLTKDDNANRASVRKELIAAHPNDRNIVSFTRGSWRVKGIIQVTKSIGDANLKHREFAVPPGHHRYIDPPLTRPALSAVPTVYTRNLKKHDEFLIFASDGLWELLSNKRAVEIVLENPRDGVARALIREAINVAATRSTSQLRTVRAAKIGHRRHFHDDISVVVVYLDAAANPRPAPLHVRAFMGGSSSGRFNLDGIN